LPKTEKDISGLFKTFPDRKRHMKNPKHKQNKQTNPKHKQPAPREGYNTQSKSLHTKPKPELIDSSFL